MKKFFLIAVVAAFVCVISAFQIDTAHADAHNLNPLYWVLAIVGGIVAIISGFIAKRKEK